MELAITIGGLRAARRCYRGHELFRAGLDVVKSDPARTCRRTAGSSAVIGPAVSWGWPSHRVLGPSRAIVARMAEAGRGISLAYAEGDGEGFATGTSQ